MRNVTRQRVMPSAVITRVRGISDLISAYHVQVSSLRGSIILQSHMQLSAEAQQCSICHGKAVVYQTIIHMRHDDATTSGTAINVCMFCADQHSRARKQIHIDQYMSMCKNVELSLRDILDVFAAELYFRPRTIIPVDSYNESCSICKRHYVSSKYTADIIVNPKIPKTIQVGYNLCHCCSYSVGYTASELLAKHRAYMVLAPYELTHSDVAPLITYYCKNSK